MLVAGSKPFSMCSTLPVSTAADRWHAAIPNIRKMSVLVRRGRDLLLVITNPPARCAVSNDDVSPHDLRSCKRALARVLARSPRTLLSRREGIGIRRAEKNEIGEPSAQFGNLRAEASNPFRQPVANRREICGDEPLQRCHLRVIADACCKVNVVRSRKRA